MFFYDTRIKKKLCMHIVYDMKHIRVLDPPNFSYFQFFANKGVSELNSIRPRLRTPPCSKDIKCSKRFFNYQTKLIKNVKIIKILEYQTLI